MNKSQLIDALSDRFDGSRKDAAHALDAVLDTITRQVAKGEKVAITGFGSFERRVRKAGTARNPATGEFLLSDQPATAAGPWFSSDRLAWHGSQLAEMRRSGIDVVSFSTGEPDFKTPDEISQAGIDAINEGFTHYTDSNGIAELRDAVATHAPELQPWLPLLGIALEIELPLYLRGKG